MQFRPSILTLGTLASLILLTACDSSSGGGAGDVDDNLAAVELLAPFTGIYELQNDWRTLDGVDIDQAYLFIDTPGAEGTSPTELHDLDDDDNCFPTRPAVGELRKDDFSNRVFLDDILLLNEAELFLSGSTLTIVFNDDFDLNNDNSTLDRISITAERVGVAQISDLAVDC